MKLLYCYCEMAYWTFFNFVNESGENLIQDWISGLAPSAKLKIKTRLDAYLRNFQAMKALPGLPLTKMLDGEGDGLFEIRFKVKSVQYRPLCFYGPERSEITILMGAMEKNNKFVPLAACSIAQGRRALVMSKRRYVREHDFGWIPANSRKSAS